MTLEELLNGIKPENLQIRDESIAHWNNLAKPLGSLGILEEDITKIASLTGKTEVSLDKAVLLVFCADNGVIAHGVSQSDYTVTTAVAKALGENTSTVNYMAKAAGCNVIPVNIGMYEKVDFKGLLNSCIRRGTDDIFYGPAMKREECIDAILCGAEYVHKMHDQGINIILLGEMGIGNTTTSAAVSCALLHKEPSLMVGRGAGLSDEGLSRKIQVIEQALKINKPDSKDVIDVLSKLGGFDLAALCGACLGGAYYRIPILLDGVITCAAALAATKLCITCQTALLASHLSAEPAAKILLQELQLKPMIQANLHLGEGSGAMLALSMLRQVNAVYNSKHTFSNLGIESYHPQ